MKHVLMLSTSLTLLLASAAVYAAGTQPATNPREEPRATAIAFLEALAKADVATARQLIVADDAAGPILIEAYAGFQRACRSYSDAAEARWGGGDPVFGRGLAFDEMVAAFSEATLRVDGDGAQLSAAKTDAFFHLRGMRLRKVAGVWKVDIGGLEETRSGALAASVLLKPMAAAVDAVTVDVKAGKYESPKLAREAREQGIKDAMRGVLRPVPPPATQGANAGSPRERALARIEELGGETEVDEKAPGKPVVKVVLTYAPATDADLELLKGLPSLRALHLNETRVTDAGLKHLKELAELRMLHVNHDKITDAGVEELTTLTHLEELGLTNTRVTDASFKHLEKLTGLKRLYISSTKVTDAGLASFAGLKNLKLLYVSGEGVTDAYLARLRKEYPEMELRK